MRKVINVSIDKIKPDPEQPRKTFDDKRIKEMAQSYSSQGVINPIEVDKDYMIITGECRWRAAKVAKLKKVPCIVNISKLKKTDRLLRQCVENAHHSDMTVMDTARSWKKLLDEYLISSRLKLKEKGHATDVGYTWLSRKLGKSSETIRQAVSMLEEPEFVQKHLEDKREGTSYFVDANKIPEEHREKIKKDIVGGRFKNRDEVRDIARAIKSKPEKAEEIMDVIDNADDIGFEVKAIANDYEPAPEKEEKAKNILEVVLKAKSDIHKFWDFLKKYSHPEAVKLIPNELRKELIETLKITSREIGNAIELLSDNDVKKLKE